MFVVLKLECEKNCHLSKYCIRNITIGEVFEARWNYWGRRDQDAPSRSQRASKNHYYLKKFFNETSKTKFTFSISGKEVCESAFLRIIGKLNSVTKFSILLKI